MQKVYGFPQNTVKLKLRERNKGGFGDLVGFFFFSGGENR